MPRLMSSFATILMRPGTSRLTANCQKLVRGENTIYMDVVCVLIKHAYLVYVADKLLCTGVSVLCNVYVRW